MASATLTPLLLGLSELGQKLEESEQKLDDFQRVATQACGSFALSVEDLASAREVLRESSDASFEEAIAAGVVIVDVGRWVVGSAWQLGPGCGAGRPLPPAHRVNACACACTCRALNALMRYASASKACVAAALYSWLLRAPGSPVSGTLLSASTNRSCRMQCHRRQHQAPIPLCYQLHGFVVPQCSKIALETPHMWHAVDAGRVRPCTMGPHGPLNRQCCSDPPPLPTRSSYASHASAGLPARLDSAGGRACSNSALPATTLQPGSCALLLCACVCAPL